MDDGRWTICVPRTPSMQQRKKVWEPCAPNPVCRSLVGSAATPRVEVEVLAGLCSPSLSLQFCVLVGITHQYAIIPHSESFCDLLGGDSDFDVGAYLNRDRGLARPHFVLTLFLFSLVFHLSLAGHIRDNRRECLPGIIRDVLVRDRAVTGAVGRLVAPIGCTPAVADDEVPATGAADRVLVSNEQDGVASLGLFVSQPHCDAS